uniref:HMG-Y-related protein A n=1 Tax=Kalanchoe fedtschenkoi TaxID=63787 RepID=A0A7N0UBI8_KALFE
MASPDGYDDSGAAPALPQYPEMILAAIDALNDPNGSNKTAVSNYIESTYSDLPTTHSTLLSHHLNRMKLSGELVMAKNNYMRPDPTSPPKRGRGRPPKPKSDKAAAEKPANSSPRPRGRPPKSKDSTSKPKPYTPSGRPRGRPPKKAKVDDSQQSSEPVPAQVSTGPPRGRGRPPKAKPSVAAVGA